MLQEYLNKNQKKEFIQFSILSIEYLVLFVLKLNKEMCLYVNY